VDEYPCTSYFDVHKRSMVLNCFDPYPQNRYDIQDSFWGGDYSGGTSLDFWCFVTVEISLRIDNEMWGWLWGGGQMSSC
jgi:hypothetical protein